MNCDSGSHRFKPFKRSRDLFCSECGFVKPFAGHTPRIESGIRMRDERESDSAMPIGQTDPYREQAQEFIEQIDFQNSITHILNEVGAAGHMRDSLEATAMDFGPTLDLEKFRVYAEENVERQPVEQNLDEALDEAFRDS